MTGATQCVTALNATDEGRILWLRPRTNPESGALERVAEQLLACSDDGSQFVSRRGIWRPEIEPRLGYEFSSYLDNRPNGRWRFYNSGTAIHDRHPYVCASRVILTSGSTAWVVPNLTGDVQVLPQSDEDRRQFHVFERGNLFVWRGDRWERHGIHEQAKHISLDPSFRYIVYAVSSDIYIHSIDRGHAIVRLDAHLGYSTYLHNNPLVLLEFSIRGTLLSAGDDGQAFLWDFAQLVGRAER